MPAVSPVLMVLYTNDAMEVRYTDGSRLHILPCGSSFYHHTLQDAHPVHGMKCVQQRSQYATSLYRGLVLPAIDFRNRFAERPYICRELLESDQIIDLYAKITEVAWPKEATTENCEVLQDGSVRITSEDEFGSLLLSSHGKDFTICYLSSLSSEKKRDRQNKSKQRDGQSSNKRTDKKDKSDNGKQDFRVRVGVGELRDRAKTPDNVDLHEALRKLDRNMKEDLNISPITQASCADSPQALSNTSRSPVTNLDKGKDSQANFRPFSTPTQELENEDSTCTPYGSTAVFRNYRHNKYKTGDNLNGSYLEEKREVEKPSTGKPGQASQGFQTDLHQEDMGNTLTGSRMSDLTGSSQGSNTSKPSQGSCDQEEIELETRCSYCWVTRHMSCDECPITWSHVLKMAQAIAEDPSKIQDTGQSKQDNTATKGQVSTSIRMLRRDRSVFSTLPHPLPVSCTAQHLHRSQMPRVYQDDKDPTSDPSAFIQGQLKVLLIDGVIYRIVRLPTISVVEVYPGDGSVLVSQGMSAHFFLHIIPQQGKLEERTYSLKSPPQASCGGFSIKNLLSRANRFLSYVRHEGQASAGICCWKHEETPLVEPMSTTLLEECTIPGYGKFSALSNGQVRIVFTDRTCLDMSCDFSKRIRNCMDHSNEANIQLPVPDKKAGTCRLLMPNGQYQMVDLQQPGVYKRYTDIAKEWAEWVNSSPSQRETFYRTRNDQNMNMSVERELQRIQCFNYVLENAVFKKPISHQIQSGAFKPYNKQETKPGTSILRNSNMARTSQSHDPNNQPIRSVQIISPPRSLVASSTNHLSHNTSTLSGHSVISSVIGQPWISSVHTRPSIPESRVSGGFKGSSLEGFDAVRQALARTSNIIKDIDTMLEKK